MGTCAHELMGRNYYTKYTHSNNYSHAEVRSPIVAYAVIRHAQLFQFVYYKIYFNKS